MFKAYLEALYKSAEHLNVANIIELAKSYFGNTPIMRMCDLGCGDTTYTQIIAKQVRALTIDVVETYEPHIILAQDAGFNVIRDDLNGPLRLDSSKYDLVISNQVIEHLCDTDAFLAETGRIVAPGGLMIVSSENGASWHNIAALMFGWQPFSLTNVSSLKTAIGNPFALHSFESGSAFAMQHKRIFTTRALAELVQLHGFDVFGIRGAGYYPLSSRLGNMNPRHAHFMAIAAKK